jgi:hypothetical protein
MKGILMLLKALGVELTEEQATMIQELIPQLPEKVNEVVQMINGCMKNFDERLRSIEKNQADAIRALQEFHDEMVTNGKRNSTRV